MKNFELYAEYYNLLYHDKDYPSEAAYINELIRQNRPGAKTILDLGCGTGRHALELEKLGYKVTGVDISQQMLQMAAKLPQNTISFHHGDICNVALDKTFDVVISLFHVMSYQQTNEQVLAMYRTISKHMAPNGLFICDGWYGPGVMNDKPVVRKKELENENLKVIRFAEPEIHFQENIVDVNYSLLVRDKKNEVIIEDKETHRMRYFFLPEIDLIIKSTGLRLMYSGEWMTGHELTDSSWNFVIIGTK